MLTKIGFTGPRTGMSEEQADMLHLLLLTFKNASQTIRSELEFHHGDCIGADETAHHIARFLDYRVVSHPPLNPSLRAFCDAYEIRDPKDYLERDRDIVDETELLLAAVNFPVKPRSGSWYTYKYALDSKRRAWLL